MRVQGFILLWTLLAVSFLLASTIWLTHGIGLIGRVAYAAQSRFEARQNLVQAHQQYVKHKIQGAFALHLQQQSKVQHELKCLGVDSCRMYTAVERCLVWSVVSRTLYGTHHQGELMLRAEYESPLSDQVKLSSCWVALQRAGQFKVLYWLE